MANVYAEDSFLKRDGSDSATVTNIDCGVKHKWLWTWLDLKDADGQFLSQYIRKLKVPGVGLCVLCNNGKGKQINYGTGGADS